MPDFIAMLLLLNNAAVHSHYKPKKRIVKTTQAYAYHSQNCPGGLKLRMINSPTDFGN